MLASWVRAYLSLLPRPQLSAGILDQIGTRHATFVYGHPRANADPDFEMRGIADNPERVYPLQTKQDLPFRRVSRRIVTDCTKPELDPRGPTEAVEFASTPDSPEFSSKAFTKRGRPLWDNHGPV